MVPCLMLSDIPGSSPYPGMSGHDIMDLIEDGYRMDKPKHCSDAM